MKAIAAMAKNRTIGKGGQIPWHLPGDLKFFKKMTMGGNLIIGRKTYESLPPKGLPGRTCFVVTRNESYDRREGDGLITEAGMKNLSPIMFGDDWWVVGGGEIYRHLLPYCADLYLTRVLKDYEGDATFPTFDHLFIQHDIVERTPEYIIIHYVRRRADI